MQFLESRLGAAKRLPLDNANSPAEPSLSEADRADLEVFLGHMLGMLPVLGVHAFEQPTRLQTAQAADPSDHVDPLTPTAAALDRPLTCRGKGVEATGFKESQGFVVLAGSQAEIATNPSRQALENSIRLRQDLIVNGVLLRKGDAYRFSQDFVFCSPHAERTPGRRGWSLSDRGWLAFIGKLHYIQYSRFTNIECKCNSNPKTSW